MKREEIEEAVKAATPGPWARSKREKRNFTLPWPSILGLDGAEVVAWPGFDGLGIPKQETAANIALICAARNYLPALLAVARAARALREANHALVGRQVTTAEWHAASARYRAANAALESALADLEEGGT